jgi:hypothetical protein
LSWTYAASTFDARHAHQAWPVSQCDAPRHGTSAAVALQSGGHRRPALLAVRPAVGRNGGRSGGARRATDRLSEEGLLPALWPGRPAAPGVLPPRAARGAPRCFLARGDVRRPATPRPAPRASRSPGVLLPGRLAPGRPAGPPPRPPAPGARPAPHRASARPARPSARTAHPPTPHRPSAARPVPRVRPPLPACPLAQTCCGSCASALPASRVSLPCLRPPAPDAPRRARLSRPPAPAPPPAPLVTAA